MLVSPVSEQGETAAHAAVKDYIIINAAAAIFLARKVHPFFFIALEPRVE